MKILVINAGSSSLKYQLFNMDDESVLAKGLCERIGIDGHLKHTPLVDGKSVYDRDVALPTHAEAIQKVLDLLLSPEYGVLTDASEIGAIGHRIVHGGEAFSSSVLINSVVMAAIENCISLAPLHNPANITGIKACMQVMKGIPQVAVFDTAFHQTMPPKAYMYALPYEYYDKYKIRRYGFHGTSHRYVSSQAAKLLGKPLEELKLISCHMGNGSSICAIDGGKSVDTSMGFTPLAGLPMGTRSGDVDPSIIEYIMDHENLDVNAALNVLNKKSGMLGVSGISSDFRDLTEAASEGNERACLALNMFSYAVAKTIGSYVFAMGGADAIIFTAGVGENSTPVRRSICHYLAPMGYVLDENKNKLRGEDRIISTDDSPHQILVIPTNEELVIARDTLAIVQ